jgi:RimJ/RimL family protein N-acetyltransferase
MQTNFPELPGLTIRKAVYSDQEILWSLRNDELVRAMSFSAEVISIDDHKQWLQIRLISNECFIFILEMHFVPIGYIRFEGRPNFDVSFILAAEARGKKYAIPCIRLGIRALNQATSFHSINAYISPKNIASVKVFEASGFHYISQVLIKGMAAFHYRLIQHQET